MPEDDRHWIPAEQRLSALFDQELETRQLHATLDELTQDPQARARWERYHLMRSALHGVSVTRQYRDIARRVGERIEQDASAKASIPEPLSTQPPPHRRGRLLRHQIWWPWVAGATLAGFAALVLVLPQPELTRPPGVMSVSQTRDGVTWVKISPEVRHNLNQLLAGHQERVSDSHLKGFLPYATLVSYDTQP